MQALVSVCLPVFNGERFLPAAIESVLAQSYTNLELLVIDDASTDASTSIIEGYAREDRRVKHWRNAESQGRYSNYNQCLQRAEGVFIKPFAQGDLLHPELLQQCTSRFYYSPGLTMVAVGGRQIDENGAASENVRSWAPPDFLPTNIYLCGIEIVRLSLSPFCNFIGQPSSVLFPASFIGKGFDTSFQHIGDLEYWFRIILDGSINFIRDDLASVRHYDWTNASPGCKPIALAQDTIYFAKKHGWMLESFQLSRGGFFASARSYLAGLAVINN